MLVVGIDPGAQQTGAAYIRVNDKGKVGRGTTYLKDKGPVPFRYVILRNKLEHYLKSLPEEPKVLAIEEPGNWLSQDAQMQDRVSIFRLHAMYAVCAAELARLFPNSVMMSVKTDVWRGANNDSEVMRAMGKKYDITRFNNQDEADALGVADYAFEISRKVWKV